MPGGGDDDVVAHRLEFRDWASIDLAGCDDGRQIVAGIGAAIRTDLREVLIEVGQHGLARAMQRVCDASGGDSCCGATAGESQLQVIRVNLTMHRSVGVMLDAAGATSSARTSSVATLECAGNSRPGHTDVTEICVSLDGGASWVQGDFLDPISRRGTARMGLLVMLLWVRARLAVQSEFKVLKTNLIALRRTSLIF